jgi:phycocyanobilin:ferredoxin oxidoreductase
VTFAQPRALPDWGDIFSNFCLFVRPTSPEEGTAFLGQVTQYLSIHCQRANQAAPIQSPAEYELILAGQRRYCSQQRQNDKTRRILERAFGSEWADRYLQTMLFDCAEATKHEEFVTVGNALSV